VFASSNYVADKLTTILVERKKLTQEQMDYALVNLKPGISVGKNLIEMGFITQRDLLDAARLQVERIVWSALKAPEAPSFEPKMELDENIVRLPFDTPSLLFTGMMGVSDRESLLELLGPLNQVVMLQGKKVFELELPTDLAKIVPLMDGTRTILELSSETAAEPMRTGAFALFLREIGWAKLYELPPLDRKALDKALAVPDPTKDPDAISPRSMLFTAIEEAGKQTVNLGDLSSMLDSIPTELETGGLNTEDFEEEPAVTEDLDDQTPEPEPEPIGRVLPLSPLESEESPIVIHHEDSDENKRPTFGESSGYDTRKLKFRFFRMDKKTLRRIFLILIALALIGCLGWWGIKALLDLSESGGAPDNLKVSIKDTVPKPDPPDTRPAAETPSTPQEPPEAPPQAPPTTLPTQQPADSQQPTQTQPAPPPVEKKDLDFSTQTRFRAIFDGNIADARSQGKAYKESLTKATWTIRLVVACETTSLQNCAKELINSKPDLFLTAIRLRDGRDCNQLFVGKFADKAAAEAQSKKLPVFFKEKGNVKIMQVSEITEKQN
jgi:hypothetical protein